MRTTMILAAFSALAVLVLPNAVSAYGAAHVGYTHVGPNGVQHYGSTTVHGANGATYSGSHSTTGTYGGGVTHTETRTGTTSYGATATHTSTGVTTGYHYAPTYSGAAYGHSSSYTYVR